MAAADPQERREYGSLGGLTGWANTEDRKARMDHVRRNSPVGGWQYFARQLGIDPEHATDEEIARAQTMRKLWYKRLTLRRRAKIKAAKARELTEESERLTAVAKAMEAHDEVTGS